MNRNVMTILFVWPTFYCFWVLFTLVSMPTLKKKKMEYDDYYFRV